MTEPAPAEGVSLVAEPVILLTGFEPFGAHETNPSQELAKLLDGRRVGRCAIAGAVLPVHHAEASRHVAALLGELQPVAVVHLGLAEGRARLGLERVALNVMDYRIADNAGYRAEGEPCVAGGPAAYFSTLPLPEISPRSWPRASPPTCRTRPGRSSATRRSTRRSTSSRCGS